MAEILNWLSGYLSGFSSTGYTGILRLSQYSYLFLLSVNPALFRIFRAKHYLLFTLGSILAVFNHRAILPFLLLIVLDLDYSKLSKKQKLFVLLFFGLQLLILLSFGEWKNA